MKSFHLVPASEGPRREFKITLGLRAGHGSAGRIYDLEEAVRTAHQWMRERAARGEPFLSGMFTRGEVLYADSAGEAASHREPVAIFAGEVLPQYAGDLDDGIVGQLLDELAGEMGRTLEQEEVHIAYGNGTWTLKEISLWPAFGDFHRRQPTRPLLQRTRYRKFESISLQRRVTQTRSS